MDYSPKALQPNAGLPELTDYVQRELNTIAQALHEQDVVFLRVLNVVPPKPRDGMIAYADGTNWNPGAGKGTYEYRSAAWVKL